MSRTLLSTVVVVAAIGLAVFFSSKPGDRLTSVDVKVPADFSAIAAEGRKTFNANCRLCHGASAAGTKNGPPLVHIYYEPNHHSDVSFQRAVRHGVRAHHWRFGNMPAVGGVSTEQAKKIIRYVRELQQANGIQ